MKYPKHLRVSVLQALEAFNAVTVRWVQEGAHTEEEVEGWRADIRQIMESGTDRDILDLCGLWRGIAEKVLGG